jgi:hypothetical protein
MPRKTESKKQRYKRSRKIRRRTIRGGCGCNMLFKGGQVPYTKRRHTRMSARMKGGGMFSDWALGAPVSSVNNPIVQFNTVDGAKSSVDIISGNSGNNIPYNDMSSKVQPLV